MFHINFSHVVHVPFRLWRSVVLLKENYQRCVRESYKLCFTAGKYYGTLYYFFVAFFNTKMMRAVLVAKPGRWVFARKYIKGLYFIQGEGANLDNIHVCVCVCVYVWGFKIRTSTICYSDTSLCVCPVYLLYAKRQVFANEFCFILFV